MHISRLIIAGAACAALVSAIGATSGSADVATPTSMTIQMGALNGSGETGTATLTAVGDKVRVTIDIAGEPKEASEPAHVHFGRCPVIKAIPAYNVGPVIGGKATNIVDLTWSDIVSGKYVVNVHESAAMLGKYVACGDIGQTAAVPQPLPTENGGH
jgi:hypothetical protein